MKILAKHRESEYTKLIEAMEGVDQYGNMGERCK